MLAPAKADIIYPDSDGQPMSDNTKQFRWIVTIKENLELLYAKDPLVFVAGDLLWYPVEGSNTIRNAPDAMVVFGRPKGDRGSYQQWQEDNIPPQVVFEILSPGNRLSEMSKKLRFYEQYGVEEYYLYDPDRHDLTGWIRHHDSAEPTLRQRLEVIEEIDNWVSPRLGIRFELQPDTLVIYRPDGERFLSFTELDEKRQAAKQEAQSAKQEAQSAKQEAQSAKQEAEAAKQEAEAAKQEAEAVKQEAARLAAKLRELGIDPNSPDF